MIKPIPLPLPLQQLLRDWGRAGAQAENDLAELQVLQHLQFGEADVEIETPPHVKKRVTAAN